MEQLLTRFGSASVMERFQQIEPKILIAVDGYGYSGKIFNRMEEVKDRGQRFLLLADPYSLFRRQLHAGYCRCGIVGRCELPTRVYNSLPSFITRYG